MAFINREILTFNYPEAKGVVVCGDIQGLLKRWCSNYVSNTG